MKMTSKIGTFVFREGITLSAAKRIRDDITGQVCNAPEGTQRIKKKQDMINFAHNVCPQSSTYLLDIELEKDKERDAHFRSAARGARMIADGMHQVGASIEAVTTATDAWLAEFLKDRAVLHA